MDNRAIAQVLADIADLLEIKGDNPFKIRAYRTAAETVTSWPNPVGPLSEQALDELPGIGKDLAGRIHELGTTGQCAFHQELLATYPATLLDILRLQGVGPKTVARLHAALGVATVDALAAAIRDGRLAGMKGIGPKKAAQILKAIEDRARHAGRRLLAEASSAAGAIVAHLTSHCPSVTFDVVGSVRRGCDTCGDIDILATGSDATVMERFVAVPGVERVLAFGDTKSSVVLSNGLQADLRLVDAPSRGAAMQYFTGSKAHNVSLRERALQRGLTLNEYGLFRLDGGERVGGETEHGIYAALGLDWVPPELREDRGELAAAATHRLPRLVGVDDLRGDLHMHTTATDGRDDIDAMARAAHDRGHEYIAITDHSRALAMANGLDETRALAHAAQVRARNGRYDGLTLLAGIECDILADGTLDLAADCLAELDIVIASVHSHFGQPPEQMTERLLRAIEHPWVDVIGHPTGRLLLSREPYAFDLERVVAAAVRHGVAFEINCQTNRLDFNDVHAKFAATAGARIVISTDAHAASALGQLGLGIQTARRAWLQPQDVLNTRPLAELRQGLRRHRSVA